MANRVTRCHKFVRYDCQDPFTRSRSCRTIFFRETRKLNFLLVCQRRSSEDVCLANFFLTFGWIEVLSQSRIHFKCKTFGHLPYLFKGRKTLFAMRSRSIQVQSYRPLRKQNITLVFSMTIGQGRLFKYLNGCFLRNGFQFGKLASRRGEGEGNGQGNRNCISLQIPNRSDQTGCQNCKKILRFFFFVDKVEDAIGYNELSVCLMHSLTISFLVCPNVM